MTWRTPWIVATAGGACVLPPSPPFRPPAPPPRPAQSPRALLEGEHELAGAAARHIHQRAVHDRRHPAQPADVLPAEGSDDILAPKHFAALRVQALQQRGRASRRLLK